MQKLELSVVQKLGIFITLKRLYFGCKVVFFPIQDVVSPAKKKSSSRALDPRTDGARLNELTE